MGLAKAVAFGAHEAGFPAAWKSVSFLPVGVKRLGRE
jgi:hypothetical protein